MQIIRPERLQAVFRTYFGKKIIKTNYKTKNN